MIRLRINKTTALNIIINIHWLLTYTVSCMIYEIKTEDVYVDFSRRKEIFYFSNYTAKLKYYDDSNKLVVCKMKEETGGLAIKEFVRLKPKTFYTFW